MKPIDDLDNFLNWFMGRPLVNLRPPVDAVTNFGTVISMVLYRSGQYQVELFISPPGQEGFETEHRHPHVDAYVVMLSGDIDFRINGESDQTGKSKEYGYRLRVGPRDLHAATISKAGGSFLSVQKWAEGMAPKSTGLDWEGESTSPEQAKLLEAQ